MHTATFWLVISVGILATAFLSAPAQAELKPDQQSSLQGSRDSTNRLIIQFRDSPITRQSADALQRMQSQLTTLGTRAGMRLSYLRTMADGSAVVTLPRRLPLAEANRFAEQLTRDPDVLYAEPDVLLQPMRTPNDPLLPQQWHFHEQAEGINLPGAWDITTGSPDIVVAVIDTGIRPHADLAGRILPGYDFVSDPEFANDGDGRDSDPSDPGDWITAAESNTVGGPFEGCSVADSSWHGTHLSGIIGAVTNNARGVSGINWNSGIVMARVLGKCGGFLSDIVDAMRWAAGFFAPGAPVNPHPAQVLNLSLGANGPCPLSMRAAILRIVSSGRIIVVAAGNQNADASVNFPSNCGGVIPVGATTRSGSRAPYSNFGHLVTISAPGGLQFFRNDSNGILSTSNTGRTTPQGDAFRFLMGTSFSAPHVSGVVSLMLSANPALTFKEIVQKLQATARPFPDPSCNTNLCGAGIVNAQAAVLAAITSVGGNVDYYPLAPGNQWGFDSILVLANLLEEKGLFHICTLPQDSTEQRCILNVALDPREVRFFTMPEIHLSKNAGQIFIHDATGNSFGASTLFIFDLDSGDFTAVPPTKR